MADLTEAEARQITKQLQGKTQQLARLLKKAHDGKVWEVMGYSSFTDWANNELPFTHGRAFQLLNIGVLTEMLNEAATLSSTFILSDKQARAISSYGREQFIKDFSAAASDDGLANNSLIQKMVNKHLNELKLAVIEDEEEQEEVRKTRARVESEKSFLINGGKKNSRTLLFLGRTLRTQTAEFPKPDELTPELREQGLSLLLEAKSNLEKTHDEIVDRKNKIDSESAPIEEAAKEEVKND